MAGGGPPGSWSGRQALPGRKVTPEKEKDARPKPQRHRRRRVEEKPAQRSDAGEWRRVFLAALRNSGNVRASCQAAGVSRKTAYQHKRDDPDFAGGWEEAHTEAVEVLEAELRRRALGGSDILLMFTLKAARPDVYRDNQRPQGDGRGAISELMRALREQPEEPEEQ